MNQGQLNYLLDVLRSDPAAEASKLIQRRESILENPEVIFAQLSDDEESDPYIFDRKLCNRLSESFWTGEESIIAAQVKTLCDSRFPDVAYLGRRLERLLPWRNKVSKFYLSGRVHGSFLDAVKQILVAAPVDAHRLREEQLNFMRPWNNPGYETATREIKSSAYNLTAAIPELYELEESWFDEIEEFDPTLEVKDEFYSTALGCGVLLALVVFLVVNVVWVSYILSF